VGLVLAAFGIFAIAGPATLAVLPLNAVIAILMYHRSRAAFRAQHLRVRRARLGFLAYFLLYQLLMSPISLSGYAQDLLRTRREW
jgi:poly-beta-1,6-N-acetyl-D-glucosamine synthase